MYPSIRHLLKIALSSLCRALTHKYFEVVLDSETSNLTLNEKELMNKDK